MGYGLIGRSGLNIEKAMGFVEDTNKKEEKKELKKNYDSPLQHEAKRKDRAKRYAVKKLQRMAEAEARDESRAFGRGEI